MNKYNDDKTKYECMIISEYEYKDNTKHVKLCKLGLTIRIINRIDLWEWKIPKVGLEPTPMIWRISALPNKLSEVVGSSPGQVIFHSHKLTRLIFQILLLLKE